MVEIAVEYKDDAEKGNIVNLYKKESHSFFYYKDIIIFNFIDSKKNIIEEIKRKYKIKYIYQRDKLSSKNFRMKRGDVFLFDLTYKKWREYGGKQYGLVLQYNKANYSSTTTIIAIVKPYDRKEIIYKSKIHSIISLNGNNYVVILNTIRTVDKLRILKKIGKISLEEQNEIDKKLIKIIL